jgi:hypothetical protein
LGSRADSCPASKIPNRVHADPAINAAPDTAAATRLRPPSSEPSAPPMVRALLALISRPALPSCSGSAVIPIEDSIRCSAASSSSAPPSAMRRAGPACAVGTASMPMPPAAAAAEPTKTNGSSRWASCQDGVAVSASRTAVYAATGGAVSAATSPAGRPRADTSRNNAGRRRAGTRSTSSATAATPAIGP